MIPPSTYVLIISAWHFFFFFSIDDTHCMRHEEIHSREIKILESTPASFDSPLVSFPASRS